MTDPIPAHLAADPADLPPVLTPAQVGERWAVRAAHVRRLIERGDLPGLHVGRHLRIRSADVVAFERTGGRAGRGQGEGTRRRTTA